MTFPVIGVTTRSAINPDTGTHMDGAVRAYLKALAEAGAAYILIPRNLAPDALRAVFEKVDGLLFPGGGDIAPARLGPATHPAVYGVDDERDELEFNLARWAAEQGKPFLGICRGIQVVNAALGGSLYLDLPSQRPGSLQHDSPRDWPGDRPAHRVIVTADTLLARVLGQTNLLVNSMHHQAVCAVAPGLELSAEAEDGVAEGVELPGHPFGLAVQWHPELMPDRPEMRRLFAGLAAAASAPR
jgi:putative glutamine amidotransferase